MKCNSFRLIASAAANHRGETNELCTIASTGRNDQANITLTHGEVSSQGDYMFGQVSRKSNINTTIQFHYNIYTIIRR